jgi:hypothetical protein
MKAEHDHGKPASPDGPRDYHDLDIRLRPIVAFLAFTAVFTVLTALAMIVFFRVLDRQEGKKAVATRFSAERELPPEPRLQTAEKRTLTEQRAIENAALHSYGWLDPAAGVVHIPIERAVDLTAERGLPVRKEAAVAK